MPQVTYPNPLNRLPHPNAFILHISTELLGGGALILTDALLSGDAVGPPRPRSRAQLVRQMHRDYCLAGQGRGRPAPHVRALKDRPKWRASATPRKAAQLDIDAQTAAAASLVVCGRRHGHSAGAQAGSGGGGAGGRVCAAVDALEAAGARCAIWTCWTQKKRCEEVVVWCEQRHYR